MGDRGESHEGEDELDLKLKAMSRRKSSVQNIRSEYSTADDMTVLPPAEDEALDGLDLRRLAFGGQALTPKRPSFFQKTVRMQQDSGTPHGNLEEIEGSRRQPPMNDNGARTNSSVEQDIGDPQKKMKKKGKATTKEKSKGSNKKIKSKSEKGAKTKKIGKRSNEFMNSLRTILLELYKAGKLLMTDKEFCKSGQLYIITGLLLSFILELFDGAPRYNVVLLVMLLAAERFTFFPVKTMRPQLVISVIMAMSVLVDIFHCYFAPASEALGGIIAVTVLVMLSKCFCLWCFLHNAYGSGRARKYLVRRVRLFSIPLNEPRRIMKEVRARILAIGWIELIATVVYFTLFIISITAMAHSYNFDNSATGGMPIAVFALVKSISSGIIAGYIAYDTDFVLCLWFFGCFGFFMPYVKNYIRTQREALGGWPLPYAFNEVRFQFLSAMKVADVIVGISGWVSVGPFLARRKFITLAGDVRSFIASLTLILVVTDIWSPLLLIAVSWLYNRFKVKEAEDELDDSDDSELDELGIRSSDHNGSEARGKIKNTKNKNKKGVGASKRGRRQQQQQLQSHSSSASSSRGGSRSSRSKDVGGDSDSSPNSSNSDEDEEDDEGSSDAADADHSSRRRQQQKSSNHRSSGSRRTRTEHDHEDIAVDVRFSSPNVDHQGGEEEEEEEEEDEHNIYSSSKEGKDSSTSRRSNRFGWSLSSHYNDNNDNDNDNDGRSSRRGRGMWSTSRAEAKTLVGESPMHAPLSMSVARGAEQFSTTRGQAEQFSTTRGEGDVSASASAKRRQKQQQLKQRKRGSGSGSGSGSRYIPASKEDGADDDYYNNDDDDDGSEDGSEDEEGEWLGQRGGRGQAKGQHGLGLLAAVTASASVSGRRRGGGNIGSAAATPYALSPETSSSSIIRAGMRGQPSPSPSSLSFTNDRGNGGRGAAASGGGAYSSGESEGTHNVTTTQGSLAAGGASSHHYDIGSRSVAGTDGHEESSSYSPLIAGHRRSVSEGTAAAVAASQSKHVAIAMAGGGGGRTLDSEIDEKGGLRVTATATPSKTHYHYQQDTATISNTKTYSPSYLNESTGESAATGGDFLPMKPSGTMVRIGRRGSSGRADIFVGGVDSIVTAPPRGLLSAGAHVSAVAANASTATVDGRSTEGVALRTSVSPSTTTSFTPSTTTSSTPLADKKSVSDRDLVIDPSATIAPGAYSVLWEQLDVAAQFKTAIKPPPRPNADGSTDTATTRPADSADNNDDDDGDNDNAAIMIDALSRHLASRGFFVVAAGGGHDNGVSKLYAFASGYPRDFYSGAYAQEDMNPVYFLAEMKVEFHKGDGMFECKSKTTHKNFSAAFVAKFSLGNVLSRS